MKHDRHIFHFGHFFAFLAPSPITSVPKLMIMCFSVPEIWHMTDVIMKFQKNEKKCLDISFYTCAPYD